MQYSHIHAAVGSLLDMPTGCKLLVEDLTGSPAVRSRLYSMGILPGTELEVCRRSCGKGGICIRVRQCSLVLGECMARSIYCRPADENSAHCRHKRHARIWRGKGKTCSESDGCDALKAREGKCCSGE